MNEKTVPEMISLREASSRVGLSYETLRKLCITGRIVHFRSGTKYLVNFPRLCDFLNGEGLFRE